MLMQSAYTFYILGLNLILAGFSDQAVTALGLYYKWQTFFFIPLGAHADLHRAHRQLQLRCTQH